MAEVGKLTIIVFLAAALTLLLGRILNSNGLFWTSIGLFVLWVICWVVEDVFDVVLIK